VAKAKKEQELNLMKQTEKHRLEKEHRIKHLQMNQRKQEFLQKLTRDKLEAEEKEFRKFSNKKEKLKRKRIKALFDAEF